MSEQSSQSISLDEAIRQVSILKAKLVSMLSLLEAPKKGKVFFAMEQLKKHPDVITDLSQNLRSFSNAEVLLAAAAEMNEAISAAKLEYRTAFEQELTTSRIHYSGDFPSYLLEEHVRRK